MNAQITAFPSISVNVGAMRIVQGGHFTSPAGDPSLPHTRELFFMERLIDGCLKAMSTPVDKPTLFEIEEEE